MAISQHRFVHVDVFTCRAFGGNQLAVFTDARGLSAAQMQAIAREMNFAESTFGPPPEFGSAGVEFLYLPLRSLDAVRRARADLDAMKRVFGDSDHSAAYPFSIETESPDAAAHARMFNLLLGPGLNEDPATGSAA